MDTLTYLENTLVDEHPNMLEVLMDVEDTFCALDALDTLDERQRCVVEMKFGLNPKYNNGEPMTYTAIGRELGRSAECIRQIHLRAVEQMRQYYMKRQYPEVEVQPDPSASEQQRELERQRRIAEKQAQILAKMKEKRQEMEELALQRERLEKMKAERKAERDRWRREREEAQKRWEKEEERRRKFWEEYREEQRKMQEARDACRLKCLRWHYDCLLLYLLRQCSICNKYKVEKNKKLYYKFKEGCELVNDIFDDTFENVIYKYNIPAIARRFNFPEPPEITFNVDGKKYKYILNSYQYGIPVEIEKIIPVD